MRSTCAFYDIKFNFLAFVQGLKAFRLNCREVNEYVAAFLCFDEAITFFSVKPFYPSLHNETFPSSSNKASKRFILKYTIMGISMSNIPFRKNPNILKNRSLTSSSQSPCPLKACFHCDETICTHYPHPVDKSVEKCRKRQKKDLTAAKSPFF